MNRVLTIRRGGEWRETATKPCTICGEIMYPAPTTTTTQWKRKRVCNRVCQYELAKRTGKGAVR